MRKYRALCGNSLLTFARKCVKFVSGKAENILKKGKPTLKKVLALIMALALVLTAASTVFAGFEEFDEEPSSYLWLVADSYATPSIAFKVPASTFKEGEVTVTAKVYFGEDVVATGEDGSGLAYVNVYSYSDEEQYNNFDYLIGFKDFAASNENVIIKHDDAEDEEVSPLGKWIDYEATFNPFEQTYGGFKGDAAIPAMLTMGIGFWNAKGTIKVANMSVRQNNEIVWAIDFSAGFDLANEDDVAKAIAIGGMTVDNEEVNWGVELPENEIEGGTNIAEGCPCEIVGGNNEGDPTVVGGNDTYCTGLTDGIASPDKEYSSKWFGFLSNNGGARDNAVTETIEGVATKIGKAIIDLGETKSFNKVRVHCWAAGVSGIGIYTDIIVHVSDDKENWTEAGYLLLGVEGEVYWAETPDSFSAQSARYVMIEYRYVNGVWGFTNEIQIIADDIVDEPEDPGTEGKLGDFDGDDAVTSDDAVYLLRHTLFADQYPVSAFADFDHDGSVTSDDAVYLLRHTLFAEQYPLSK